MCGRRGRAGRGGLGSASLAGALECAALAGACGSRACAGRLAGSAVACVLCIGYAKSPFTRRSVRTGAVRAFAARHVARGHNFARIVTEQVGVFSSGVFTDRRGMSSAPPARSTAVRKCPPTKCWWFPGTKYYFRQQFPYHPTWPCSTALRPWQAPPPSTPARGRSRGERHVSPRADSCWPPKKGGITCWWDNGAQRPRRSTTRTSADGVQAADRGDNQRTGVKSSGHMRFTSASISQCVDLGSETADYGG